MKGMRLEEWHDLIRGSLMLSQVYPGHNKTVAHSSAEAKKEKNDSGSNGNGHKA